jgi:YbbR domain-containing protein
MQLKTMHKSEQIAFISHLWRKMKVSLFRRDTFIFLFFLIISAIFWLIISLNKTYETHISIPIKYENTPAEIELTANLPSVVVAKVKDKGTILLGYSRLPLKPLIIDFNDYVAYLNLQEWSISTVSSFEKEVKNLLNPSTQIIDFYPRNIEIVKQELSSKKIPVVVDAKLDYARQYYPSDSISCTPDSVVLYGSKAMLDTIYHISTQPIISQQLKDTLQITTPIASPQNGKVEPESVQVTIPVEFFTEGKQLVPIKVINVPNNMQVRTFPSEVEVTYLAGFSKFKGIIPADFTVTINYNDLISSNSTTHNPTLEQYPAYVLKPKIKQESVTWIIEIIK